MSVASTQDVPLAEAAAGDTASMTAPEQATMESDIEANMESDMEANMEADFEQFCLEQVANVAPPNVVWWGNIVLPKSTAFVFSEVDLYNTICESCRSMTNVVVDQHTGRVLRTFCDSCRIVLSRHGYNHCQARTAECEVFRFVDEVGTIAPLCRGCHRFEQKQRSARRVTSTRRNVQQQERLQERQQGRQRERQKSGSRVLLVEQ